jgi:hypothetical protein
MKHILSATLLLSLALVTTIHAQTYTVTASRGGATETYQGNMDTGELTISWGQETKVFADIVGYAGQTTRALVSFNGTPALTYENAGSNTHFEVFYTLALKDNVPVINCAYANIRNGQNGASIRKAVCNLDTALSSEYENLISPYSDKWLDASTAMPTKPLMAEPSKPLDVPLGRLGVVDIALRYDSLDVLLGATPKTIATTGSKTHEVSSGNAYFVYDADGTTPLSLDVETDIEAHTLKRLTSAELLGTLESSSK